MTETYPLLTPSMVIKDNISQYGGVYLQFRASEIFVNGVRPNDIFQARGFSEYGFEDGFVRFDGFLNLGDEGVVVWFWRTTIDG